MQRNMGLDGLRAIAALIVVAFHTKIWGFKGGSLGVTLFFVLSGYLITMILCKEIERNGKIDFFKFQSRRLLRLYPALIVMLSTFVIVAYLFPNLFPKVDIKKEFLLSGLYLSNISVVMAKTPSFTHHTWTLAMEIQFYLLWPIVVAGVLSCFNRSPLIPFCVMFFALVAWRFWVLKSGQGAKIYYSFDTRASSLVLGAVIYSLQYRLKLFTANILGVLALAFIMLNMNGYFLPGKGYYFPFLALELACGLLILSLLTDGSWLSRLFSIYPLPIIGLWSYSIYLWHYPISRYTRVHYDPWLSFSIVLVLSLILSYLTYELIEKRATNWIRQKFMSTTKPDLSKNSQISM